ncbi:SAV_2336 N-terminal domain-related protein [Coleofasciculus sp. E2-BRE-01]|uniref:SAV_2336 N-terminal domain-related protein n=1 Tax=Coleofasciculus sp. E2-BRE-01 TaxID=3069524 RepID=UPI003303D8D1
MKFDRLIALLEQDLNLTGTEIAEILWLAAQRRNSASTQPPTPVSPSKPTPAEPPIIDSTVSSTPSSTPVPESSLPTIPSRNQPAARVYAKTTSRHDSLEIALPDVAAIPHPLKLARAFRPLMQWISSGKTTILDEVATVDSTAELNGIVSPILKPFQALRFDLELVIDQSDSMIFWRQTTQELEQLYKHYGIFRYVRTWGMVTDEQGEIRLKKGIGKNALSHRFYRPQILIDPSGHRLILVVSDCVGEKWRNGKAVSILDTWGNQNNVAIVQMLPTRMWWRTGLSGGTMVQLDSRCQAAVANRNLAISEILLGEDFDPKQGVKVPVLSLEPDLAQTWSEMVVGKGTVGATGFVFPPASEENSKLSLSNPPFKGGQGGMETGLERGFQERYYDFRLSSSPMARELASLLAAAPVVNLPIVRLIRRTLLRELQPVHVAEVFLGGILHPQGLITPETNPDEIQYQFIGDASTDESETIRRLFLKDSPTAKSVQIVTVISRYFAQRLGKNLKQFYGLLKQPDALKQVQAETVKEFEPEHFAEITTHILKQLGGAYVRLAEEIEAGWQGESVEATPIVTQQQSQSSSAGFPSLDTSELELFSFETVFVNRRGEIIKRETHTAQYFREQLALPLTWDAFVQYFRKQLPLPLTSWDAFIKRVADAHKLFEEDERQAFLVRFNERNLPRYDSQVAQDLNISEVTLQRRLRKGVYTHLVTSCPQLDTAKKGKFKIVRDWLKKGYVLFQRNDTMGIKKTAGSHPFREETIAIDMVVIPGGTFIMGSPEEEGRGAEHPQHEVTVPSFFMSKTPITQAQWRIIASRTDLKINRDLDPAPARFKDNPNPKTLPNYRSSETVPTRWDRPVEQVSWYDAVEFCARLSLLTGREYRLPSEAEWEYACRAILPDSSSISESNQNPTYPPFHFGETLTDQLANYNANYTYADEPKGQYRKQTTPVGSFSPNAFGLYDMHGNVWEWCLDDWHDNYEGAPSDGEVWLIDNNDNYSRILRGGCWNSIPVKCRAAYRDRGYPTNHYYGNGFRVVCVSGWTL